MPKQIQAFCPKPLKKKLFKRHFCFILYEYNLKKACHFAKIVIVPLCDTIGVRLCIRFPLEEKSRGEKHSNDDQTIIKNRFVCGILNDFHCQTRYKRNVCCDDFTYVWGLFCYFLFHREWRVNYENLIGVEAVVFRRCWKKLPLQVCFWWNFAIFPSS